MLARPPVLMWFRRDLRLADHPALQAASETGPVVPLFVHDPKVQAGANRTAFLHATLDAMNAGCRGALVERIGPPEEVVPALASQLGADAVFVTADFGPYGANRDALVASALEAGGMRLERRSSPYAVDPGSVFNQSGLPYRVFTPFSRAWRRHGWDDPAPASQDPQWHPGAQSDPRPPTPHPAISLPAAGEAAAWDLTEQFVAGAVEGYDAGRDRPDLDVTSRLSTHLKFGTLHPRQLLDLLGDRPGPVAFASELCWREFYADVVHHRPETIRENVNPRLDAMEWDEGPEADARFDAWRSGRTGFPIVDAGMRQLATEGWMHNRVRMIVASFLVKDLHLHWRRGAAHFMEHLIDGDVASNSQGWQWTAGTGTDAAPFFRVFNPTTQGRRFDPHGDYVRRHVEELRLVPGIDVHEPGPVLGYAPPLVDHATERVEALRRYHECAGTR